MVTESVAPSLYAKHYVRAYLLAVEYGGSERMLQEARLALWDFCSTYKGGPFVKQAEQSIRERLQNIT